MGLRGGRAWQPCRHGRAARCSGRGCDVVSMSFKGNSHIGRLRQSGEELPLFAFLGWRAGLSIFMLLAGTFEAKAQVRRGGDQYAAHRGVRFCELSKCGCHGGLGTPIPQRLFEDRSCGSGTRSCIRDLQNAEKGELNPKRSRDNLQQDAQGRSPLGSGGWHLHQHAVWHGEGARKTRLEERLPGRCPDGSTPHFRREKVLPGQGDPVGHHRGSRGDCFRVHQRLDLNEPDLQQHSSNSSLVPCKFGIHPFVCA